MKSGRQETLRHLVRTGTYKTQDDLVRALAAAGYAVGQATVSRDIRALGLVKAPGPDGERYFAMPPQVASPAEEERLRKKWRDTALGWEASGPLVVIRTPPGEAQGLARVLDEAAWPELLGVLAGHDQVLVVAREGRVPGLAERLRELGGT